MGQSKDQARVELENLVSQFKSNLEQYKDVSYKEAPLRIDFLNKFLKILGWDVDNSQGLTPSFREVVTEDDVLVEGRSKEPDYAIRKQDGTRFFFIEAKKPQVNISKAKEPAFQLRRYGWSADLAISVLTSFEFFAVYDCTIKPIIDDDAKKARLKLIYFEDYLVEFDYIWDHFSKTSVLNGSLNKFKSKKSKKGTASVDKEFLESLDDWRMKLAINIHAENTLDEERLNFIVQQTIDRIIFLRIAEDRHVEEYGSLRNCLKGKNYYKNLFELFFDADARYNSGLFKQDQILEKLVVSNDTLETIISELYYPKSPYEFSVLPIEILGKAYEQFLGKKILITETGKIKVDEKPEVRKAGGVYYTPRYIVEYIVKNTVGKMCEGKTVQEVAKLKILDPASGSGSFLIYAYEYLLNWHKDYISRNIKKFTSKELKELRTPAGELTTKFKGKILLNNIYGVDIDANAVEVTKLSLLLKCMEGETIETVNAQFKLFRERLLSTLDNNIKCGNSLIDYDIYSKFPDLDDDIKVKRQINAFNWKLGFKEVFSQGGFDVVIGNPPYFNINILMKIITKYFEKNYKEIHTGYNDVMYYFIYKSIDLLNKDGVTGLITSNYFLGNKYAEALRVFINKHISSLLNFKKHLIFSEASIHTSIIFAKKTPIKDEVLFFEAKENLLENESVLSSMGQSLKSRREMNGTWLIAQPSQELIIEKIQRHPLLGDMSTIEKGSTSGKNKVFCVSSETAEERQLEKDILRKNVKNGDIDKYVVRDRNNYGVPSI